MTQNTRPPALRVSLILVLIAFVLMGIEYAFASPLFEVSDEVRHFAYIEHLAQGKGLIAQDPSNPGFYEQDGSQPPLYYALMTPIAQLTGMDDFRALAQFNPHSRLGFADATDNWNMLIHRAGELAPPWQKTTLAVLLMRLAGVLMGAVTVFCAHGVAEELVRPALRALGANKALEMAPVLAAALAAFTPMFLYISASVNNDTLVVMLSSLGVWLAARAINRGATPGRAALAGVVMGLAALTKASALALVALAPLCLMLAAWARGRSVARALAVGVAAGLPIALIAGWWYVRNQVLYQDFTGTWVQAVIDGLREPPITLLDALGEWSGFRQAYWGLFGGVNIPMPWWIYTFLDAFAGLGFVGSVIYFFSPQRRRDTEKKEIRNEEIRNNPPRLRVSAVTLVWLLCGGVMALNLASLIRWTMLTYASQGRLMFPSIAIISSFMAIGVAFVAHGLLGWDAGFLRQARLRAREVIYQPRFALAHIGQFALLAGLAPLVFIAPAYARPPRGLSEAQLPADLARAELRYGSELRWIGYRVAPERQRLVAGEPLRVTLYWQATQAITRNLSLGLRLFSQTDAPLGVLDTYPGGGMLPTTHWQPGEIIADSYALRLPLTLTQAGNVWLDVSVWDFETKQFLKTFDGAGNPTGRQRYLAGGFATPQTQTPPTAGGYFEKARLANAQTAQSGRLLSFSLDWLVTGDVGESYTTFAHVFNTQGERVAQGDAPPRLATRWWRTGDVIRGDLYTMEMPPALPPGAYTLKFGLYRAGDGARMPAFDAQGRPVDDAALTLAVDLK